MPKASVYPTLLYPPASRKCDLLNLESEPFQGTRHQPLAICFFGTCHHHGPSLCAPRQVDHQGYQGSDNGHPIAEGQGRALASRHLELRKLQVAQRLRHPTIGCTRCRRLEEGGSGGGGGGSSRSTHKWSLLTCRPLYRSRTPMQPITRHWHRSRAPMLLDHSIQGLVYALPWLNSSRSSHHCRQHVGLITFGYGKVIGPLYLEPMSPFVDGPSMTP